jgi:hypothetical protein
MQVETGLAREDLYNDWVLLILMAKGRDVALRQPLVGLCSKIFAEVESDFGGSVEIFERVFFRLELAEISSHCVGVVEEAEGLGEAFEGRALLLAHGEERRGER